MNTIFTTDKNGKKRYLDIRVEEINDVWCIVKATGQVGGKEATSVTEVPLGFESATKRAKTMWKNANTKATAILPMLANKWEDREKYISEPFYVQPKLDGVRLLVSKDGGISRTGKIIPGTEILGKGLKEGQYVDGEAFDPNLTFEELTSTFKTDPLKLKFHVFDYFDMNALDMTFEQRWEAVKSLKNKHYVFVETKLVAKKRQLPLVHKKHVEEGHEGTMIRDRFSVYEVGQRSNYLLKHKDFQTEEYEIIGATTGHGRDANCVVWICKTEEGNVFNARPEGTLEDREYKYANKERFIGKMLTVRFQNLTDKNVPRFPVGVAIRDYE
jgi:ATP-dependent DNA ligase